MSEIIWRWWRFSIADICSVGYPKRFIYLHLGSLFLELGIFGHHYEVRFERGAD